MSFFNRNKLNNATRGSMALEKKEQQRKIYEKAHTKALESKIKKEAKQTALHGNKLQRNVEANAKRLGAFRSGYNYKNVQATPQQQFIPPQKLGTMEMWNARRALKRQVFSRENPVIGNMNVNVVQKAFENRPFVKKTYLRDRSVQQNQEQS